ncbi:putative RiPP precursor [Halobellus ruber]|uniref:Putative RiPP n=1 Tax=Halobellus ruber TaxID=2761102 RepID=A0A7J9SI25_9EURY|nr:putative RiPP precursor [Halobellus ruber]MBB6646620.1 putative RiPP precursor [Halobellus ruber]
MTKEYDTPEVTEYGPVATITEAGITNKKGSSTDEYSKQTGLTGSDIP